MMKDAHVFFKINQNQVLVKRPFCNPTVEWDKHLHFFGLFLSSHREEKKKTATCQLSFSQRSIRQSLVSVSFSLALFLLSL